MPHLFVHGRYLAKDLQDALGIDRPIWSIKIEADCRTAASVTIEFIPSPEESEKIKKLISKYHLASIDNYPLAELVAKQFVQLEDGVLYINGIKVAENCK
jgi:hypothetical protein